MFANGAIFVSFSLSHVFRCFPDFTYSSCFFFCNCLYMYLNVLSYLRAAKMVTEVLILSKSTEDLCVIKWVTTMSTKNGLENWYTTTTINMNLQKKNETENVYHSIKKWFVSFFVDYILRSYETSLKKIEAISMVFCMHCCCCCVCCAWQLNSLTWRKLYGWISQTFDRNGQKGHLIREHHLNKY